MTEGKIEKGKTSFSIFFFIYTIHLAYLKFETLIPIGAEISVTEMFIGEKEMTDMLYVAVFVTQYNSSLSSFVPNFRILSQVDAGKSLTE